MITSRIRDWLLSRYFPGVDPKKVIRTDQVVVNENGLAVSKKILTIADEPISPEQARILKEEAAYVKRTMLWDLYQNTIAETARKTMFEKSKDYNDMIVGKSMLYNLDVLKKIIDRILE